MTFIIFFLRNSFLADSRAHTVIVSCKWLLSFDSGKGTIAGSLLFAIDIIFAEVSIARVYKVRGIEFHLGYILPEGHGVHLISWTWSDWSIRFVILATVDATYFFPLWHKYFIKKQYNLINSYQLYFLYYRSIRFTFYILNQHELLFIF